VRGFATIMRKLTGLRDLPQWIDHVHADELQDFAYSPTASNTTSPPSPPASACPTAPARSKDTSTAKMIKRQMYGRANFDLLRRRILAPL
jgi:hypothetical protein